MLGVCRRYLNRLADAEDVLMEALYKVLTRIDQYSGDGSFEGWIRRVVVNECLMFLRKNDVLQNAWELPPELDESREPGALHRLQADDLLGLLDRLPDGYRTVFNLYVIEGYKHREIAELLGISINTSKSQLILARRRLEELLRALNYPGIDPA